MQRMMEHLFERGDETENFHPQYTCPCLSSGKWECETKWRSRKLLLWFEERKRMKIYQIALSIMHFIMCVVRPCGI